MLKRMFHWFYCLPIPAAVCWMFLATALFARLREKNGDRRAWKWAVAVALLCWLAVILYGTVGQRGRNAVAGQVQLIPLYSYYLVWKGGDPEGIRSNLMNMILFYPAGLLGTELMPANWKRIRKLTLILAAGTLLGGGIECMQLRWGLGLVETDDLIHNVFGAYVGGLACVFRLGGTDEIRKRGDEHGRD